MKTRCWGRGKGGQEQWGEWTLIRVRAFSGLKLALSLHLDELITSALNPLRFCSQALVANFAAITSHYQLAYCNTVLEKNMRIFLPVAMQDSYGFVQAGCDTLDVYFPFDPYLLQR